MPPSTRSILVGCLALYTCRQELVVTSAGAARASPTCHVGGCRFLHQQAQSLWCGCKHGEAQVSAWLADGRIYNTSWFCWRSLWEQSAHHHPPTTTTTTTPLPTIGWRRRADDRLTFSTDPRPSFPPISLASCINPPQDALFIDVVLHRSEKDGPSRVAICKTCLKMTRVGFHQFSRWADGSVVAHESLHHKRKGERLSCQ